MLALRELQKQFAAALFGGTGVRDVDVPEHVDIYRNNLREGFVKALAIAFPVIEKLVGFAYFRWLALEFLGVHPSRSGNLHHIGAPFPGFLHERFAHTEYAYFADVAALEWAYQQVLIAADAAPITADFFAAVDPRDYEDLRFNLHPATALVQSSYPVIRIWRANQPDAMTDEPIDLGAGGDNVLVRRAAEWIELHRLAAGDFAALRALSSGASLGAALEAAQSADARFDLGAALRRFLSLGLLRTPL
ncbi:MAG TPA: DNA-binding domain-containing protein [Polyangiaceae bacterium]|nr:DNA-binding domain-containing protein [Polyangiaceae bacterium]